MLRGLFVTGTGTGVGKTVAAAAILHRYRGRASLRYWKPIQTGIESDDDTAAVRHLGMCHDEELLCDGIRLPGQLSPHLAAELSDTRIDIRIVQDLVECESARSGKSRWIIEGAGGAMVPINDAEFMADFMMQLQLPVLIVSRADLGTINHTLLTIEALRARSLQVAGVVMVGVRNSGNRDAIERYGDVEVLGELPYIPDLTPEKLRSWAEAELDPQGVLWECLQ